MTKIFIDEDLNLDKTHFKTLQEFQEYISDKVLNAESTIENTVKEESVVYAGNTDAKIEGVSELQHWQKEIIEKRLDDINSGQVNFQEFNSAIDEIEREL